MGQHGKGPGRNEWTRNQVYSSEFHRNPDTDSQIGLRSENPGIFVLLRGGRGRNFLVSKGGYINTLWFSAEWLRFGQSINQSFPTSKPCRGEVKPELIIIWYVHYQDQHFYNRQVFSASLNCSVVLVWPHPLTPLGDIYMDWWDSLSVFPSSDWPSSAPGVLPHQRSFFPVYYLREFPFFSFFSFLQVSDRIFFFPIQFFLSNPHQIQHLFQTILLKPQTRMSI